MIARFQLVVPFTLAVPEGALFKLHTFDVEGYRVTFHPPIRTDHPMTGRQVDSVKVDGMAGFLGNGLVVEFRKDQFDRTSDTASDLSDPTVDPPASIVLDAVNFFLARLRFVHRAPMVHLLSSLLASQWRLTYLNDDGSELQQEEGLVRSRFSLAFHYEYLPVHPETWDAVFSLTDFDVPIWDDLRLDALGALPHVGTTVVLAFASLETFVARLLDALAERSGLSPGLWRWINRRASFLAQPSNEEQFDQLLKEFVGHSLKEDETLWTAFQQLRKARNTFVHEGRAVIGGQRVDDATARLLVRRVDEIVAWVRQWLPGDLQWPTFDHSHIKCETSHTLLSMGKARGEAELPEK